MITRKSTLPNAFSFVLIVLFIFALDTLSLAKEQDAGDQADFFEMPIEELMNIEVVSTATLTKTSPRLVPSAVTTVTREDIQSSGARSLYELLDIYIPNMQWLRHHWEADVMGLRGIISDRNDKYLLLVNGRAINHRTHMGGLSEQDMVLLSDIHHIDVVRGSGSALYGPGAVSMVINIVTLNADTFQGTELTTRAGAVEEFYTSEIKHGKKFSDNDGGYFVYAGIGEYVGASKYDAPQIYPFTFPSQSSSRWSSSYTGPPPGSIPGEGTQAGEPMTNMAVPNDGAASRGLPPLKLHVQVKKDNWDIWARYTRGGKEMSLHTGSFARVRWGMGENVWYNSATGTTYPVVPNFYSYQQATTYIGYKQELTQDLDIDYSASYSMLDFERFCQRAVWDASREDQYIGKAVLNWRPNDQHKVAFGAEVLHLELGLKSPGWPDSQPISSQLNPMPRWSTNLYSLFGEYQWNINDKWTTFLGARLDDHTYTEPMFSPRAAIVHTPTDKDTLKLMWSRSVRANFEEQMKRQSMSATASQNSKPEVLDSAEFRYERQQTKNLDLAASFFVHYSLTAIGWNQSQLMSTLAGTQKEYGIELEASYHTESTRLTLSHGYTKLYDFDLEPDRMTSIPVPPTQAISAMPYGYGDDLTNWSNHITKLTAQYKLNDHWTLNGSLRTYWGFPGKKDMDEYYPYSQQIAAENRNYPPYTSWPIIEEGWKRTYRASCFLNLGLQYKPSKNLTINLNGYNLLGVFNKDFNKRNYIQTGGGGGTFRSHAPAVAVSLAYTF